MVDELTQNFIHVLICTLRSFSVSLGKIGTPQDEWQSLSIIHPGMDILEKNVICFLKWVFKTFTNHIKNRTIMLAVKVPFRMIIIA